MNKSPFRTVRAYEYPVGVTDSSRGLCVFAPPPESVNKKFTTLKGSQITSVFIWHPFWVQHLFVRLSGGGANTRDPRLLSVTPPGYWNVTKAYSLLKSCAKHVGRLCGSFKQPTGSVAHAKNHSHSQTTFHNVFHMMSTRAKPCHDTLFATCKQNASPLLLLLTFINKIIIIVAFHLFRFKGTFNEIHGHTLQTS